MSHNAAGQQMIDQIVLLASLHGRDMLIDGNVLLVVVVEQLDLGDGGVLAEGDVVDRQEAAIGKEYYIYGHLMALTIQRCHLRQWSLIHGCR